MKFYLKGAKLFFQNLKVLYRKLRNEHGILVNFALVSMVIALIISDIMSLQLFHVPLLFVSLLVLIQIVFLTTFLLFSIVNELNELEDYEINDDLPYIENFLYISIIVTALIVFAFVVTEPELTFYTIDIFLFSMLFLVFVFVLVFTLFYLGYRLYKIRQKLKE